MAAGYGELLRSRHAARLLCGTLVGRLPSATGHIAIVLFVRAEGGGYALVEAPSRRSTGWPPPWASRCWAAPSTCTGSRG